MAGARVERINWAANPSARGLKESVGMMVNYHYRLDEIEANHSRCVRWECASGCDAANVDADLRSCDARRTYTWARRYVRLGEIAASDGVEALLDAETAAARREARAAVAAPSSRL